MATWIVQELLSRFTLYTNVQNGFFYEAIYDSFHFFFHFCYFFTRMSMPFLWGQIDFLLNAAIFRIIHILKRRHSQYPKDYYYFFLFLCFKNAWCKWLAHSAFLEYSRLDECQARRMKDFFRTFTKHSPNTN